MNLAEIRKKAQQEKEAQQAVAAQLEQDNAASTGYLDGDHGDLDSEFVVTETSFAGDDAFEDLDAIALDEPVAQVDDYAEPIDAGPLTPEDIFPEQPEEVYEPVAATISEIPSPASRVLKAASTPIIEDKPAQAGFDPIAAMLEGRAKAGYDDDAFIGPGTGLEKDADDSQELLCFRVASEEYALNIMEIKEIIKPREVTEVPRVPAFVSGVLSLRGIIIPIFDMTARLGLPREPSTGKERVIVVKNGEEGFCGILVDEVVQVVRIEDRFLEPPPTVLEGIDRDFVSGIGRFQGRMLILLNMEKILDITLY